MYRVYNRAAAKQRISLSDCGDDPCFFLRGEPKVPGPMNPVGGTRGCFTAELRAGAEKEAGFKGAKDCLGPVMISVMPFPLYLSVVLPSITSSPPP